MNEHVIIETRRRQPSAGAVAFRTERKAMVPIRREIGELQRRAAFAEPRALRSNPGDKGVQNEISELKTAVVALQERVEEIMGGAGGFGPADDCRKALAHITRRLVAMGN